MKIKIHNSKFNDSVILQGTLDEIKEQAKKEEQKRNWKQGRVLQFFSKDELLIGKDFWNFVSKSDDGYDLVLSEYRENAHLITEALESIKQTYLD